MKRDFNNLKTWLIPILDERGLSVEKLASNIDVSRATIYHWLNDRRRPTEENMAAICRELSVPLEEGLAQYTPNTNGRPSGKQSRPRALTVRR